jgi:hypothetical protein
MIKDRRLQIVVATFAALGGLVALMKYLEDKEHRRTAQRVAKLDEQIKKEQLKRLMET